MRKLSASSRGRDMPSSTSTCDSVKTALLALLRTNDSRSHDDEVLVGVLYDGGPPAYVVKPSVAIALSLTAELSHVTGRLFLANERSFLLFEHNVQAILRAVATQKQP
jgi:hypothetical protein